MAKKKKKSKKKNTGFNIISILLMMVCIGIIAFSGWKLVGYLIGYKQGENEYEELRSYIEEQEIGESGKSDTPAAKRDKCPIKVDFKGLSQINSDIVGWIYIPNSGVNYPIVQNQEKGNDYYLHRTFEKKENFSGSIFLDELCESDFSADNSIIYGHNLKTGEMFGFLKKMYDTNYNEKANYKNYPIIWILTPEKIMEYKVYAGREISVSKNKEVYTVEFASNAEYEEYLKTAKEKSLFKSDVEVDASQPSITLSTCTSDTENGRFIVQAIQVQEISQ